MSYTAEPKQQDTNIKVPLISKIAYGMGDVGCNFSWICVPSLHLSLKKSSASAMQRAV